MDDISEGIPPMSYQINYDLDDLNLILLEKNPKKYLQVLSYLSRVYEPNVIKSILNQGDYYNNRNHVLSLASLVSNSKYQTDKFYESGEYQELAVTILEMMINCGANIYQVDSNNKGIIDILCDNDTIGNRSTGDEQFIKRVKEICY